MFFKYLDCTFSQTDSKKQQLNAVLLKLATSRIHQFHETCQVQENSLTITIQSKKWRIGLSNQSHVLFEKLWGTTKALITLYLIEHRMQFIKTRIQSMKILDYSFIFMKEKLSSQIYQLYDRKHKQNATPHFHLHVKLEKFSWQIDVYGMHQMQHSD